MYSRFCPYISVRWSAHPQNPRWNVSLITGNHLHLTPLQVFPQNTESHHRHHAVSCHTRAYFAGPSLPWDASLLPSALITNSKRFTCPSARANRPPRPPTSIPPHLKAKSTFRLKTFPETFPDRFSSSTLRGMVRRPTEAPSPRCHRLICSYWC